MSKYIVYWRKGLMTGFITVLEESFVEAEEKARKILDENVAITHIVNE